MKQTCLIFILLLSVTPVISQNTLHKFWIPFTDKNGTPYTVDNPSEYLSERALERRLRYSIPITKSDLPVNPAYIDSLKKLDFTVLYTSRWFNSAVISTLDSGHISATSQLPFVRSAIHLSRDSVTGGGKHKVLIDKFASETLDYGLAATQIMIHQGDKLHSWGYLGKDMVIAILDVGFYNVDSLRAFDSLRMNNQIIGTRDFVKPGNDVFREHTHGMSVLSIIGGNIPGELVGTAPAASFLLLRSEDPSSEQKIEEANWIAAAEFADSAGADIINSSLGYSKFDDSLQNYTYEDMDGNSTLVTRGADMAASKGLLVVVSAGNSGNTPWLYITAPADGDSVMAVGAVDQAGIYVPFSSQGPTYDGRIKPNLVAVGYGTFVQRFDGTVGPGAGTSFSAPVISGLAACLWQKFRDLPNYEIIKVMEQSSSLFPYPNHLIGYGIPNMTVANDIITGDPISKEKREFTIFPNPAVSSISVSLSVSEGNYIQYDIFDLEGQKMGISGSVTGTNITEFTIRSIDKITPGIYILKVTTQSHIYSIKFVKR
jgi:subtilisin family serine protease